MRLDGYVRVSRVGKRSGESFISPEQQRTDIERWATSAGATIAEWHTDLDETGGKLTRPGLDRALDRVRTKQTGGIAVARVDRFSRAKVGDALDVCADVHEQGGKVVLLDLNIDTTTPVGEKVLTDMLSLARMQRRQIGENWRDAQTRAVERGVKITAHVPLGYSQGEDGRLTPNEDAPVVREVFRRRADGATWGELATYVNAHARARPPRAAEWTGRLPERMIRNRVYLGESIYGSVAINRNAHEAIISEDEFRRAQAAAGVRPVSSQEGGALLAGLVRCAGCRYMLRSGANGRLAGAKVRTYSCHGKHGGGRCEARASVTASIIEGYVVERFQEVLKGIGARALESSAGLREAQERVAQARGRMVDFRDDLAAQDTLGRDHWLEGLQARVAALESAEADLAELEAAASAVDIEGLVWEDMTTPERRRLLAGSIDCIFLRRTGQTTVPIAERVHICWRGQGPQDLPTKGRSVPVRPFDFPHDNRSPVDAGVAGA